MDGRPSATSKANNGFPSRSKPLPSSVSENVGAAPNGSGHSVLAKAAVEGNVKAARRRESGFLKIDTIGQSDARDEMINDLKEDLNKLQKCCTCVICQDMLYEPYTFQCGHVFCYTCIIDWLRQATSKKRGTCPQCREPIKVRPSPAYLIKDMIETFVYRAEIMTPNAAGAEMRKMQREASAAVERDKASTAGLFRGLFDSERRGRALGIRDPEDDILRCPECNWEVHDGRCEHCGIRVRELRDGDDLSDESDEDDDLDYDSDRDPEEMPERWMDDFTVDEDDEGLEEDSDVEWEDEEDFEANVARVNNGPGHRRNEPIVLDEDEDDDDDDMPQNHSRPGGGRGGFFGGRGRSNARNARNDESEDEDDDSEDDDTEGSLHDFVEHDTPQTVQRGTRAHAVNSRPRGNGPWALSSSSPAPQSPNSTRTSRRPNARRTIMEDDEDDQSSVSEISSHPTPSRNHMMLSSDYDEDEEEALLQQYQPLGHQTATEDEDDGFSSPPQAAGRQRAFTATSVSTPGSVFSVPEEDEGDQDGDNDDSEDEDGDIRMGEGHRTVRRLVNPQRRTLNGSNRNQPLQVDSGSDSEPVQRRRRPRATGSGARSGYFTTHHRGSNGSSRNRTTRVAAEIDPRLQNLFARHSQERQENMLNFLGRRNSESVSPARSLTPVQRDHTGNSRNSAARSSKDSGSRESTPVNHMDIGSPPPPFSPMQGSQNSFSTIGNSPAPMVPGSPISYQFGSQSTRPTQSPRASRSPSWQPQSPTMNSDTNSRGGSSFVSPPPRNSINAPITISSSTSSAPRVRSRTSRPGLRATGSRLGLRSGTASPAPSNASFTSGTSIAGTSGRNQPGPSVAARTTRSTTRPLTSEDVRARGEAVRQAQMANQAQALGRRNSRRELPTSSTGSSNASNAGSNTTGPQTRGGRRLGAVIGSNGSAGSRPGPMLVIGSEDD